MLPDILHVSRKDMNMKGCLRSYSVQEEGSSLCLISSIHNPEFVSWADIYIYGNIADSQA